MQGLFKDDLGSGKIESHVRKFSGIKLVKADSQEPIGILKCFAGD